MASPPAAAASAPPQEMRLREGMAMMGLTSSAYLASWAITAVAQFALSALLIAAVTAGSVYRRGRRRLRRLVSHNAFRALRAASGVG